MSVKKYKDEESKDFFDEIVKENSEKSEQPLIEKSEPKLIEKPKETVLKSNIEPKLSFLEDLEENNKVYIGRKKSVLKTYGSVSSAHLGRIYEEDCKDKNVYLDGLNPHVVFIDGSRGSGKSYGLGVIAEELAKNNHYIGQVVVDPVGVFWSMKFPNQETKELKMLEDWGLKPEGLNNLKVFVPEGMVSKISQETYDETFSMFPSLLSADDWCLTFGIDRFSPTGLLLEKTLHFVKDGYNVGDEEKSESLSFIEGKGEMFTLEDIISCLSNSSEFRSSKKGYKPDSIRALVSRFEAAKSWGIFSDNGTPLSKLSRENQLTVLDTSFLDDNITALVIGILARRLLSARKLITRQDAVKKFDNKENSDFLLENEIPPTWLYIDEAHTLIPSGNQQTPATSAIIEYVKQGRRPGCSLVFATQQPSAINTKVLSQVDIFISHKLVFNDDIHAIQKRMPAIIPNEYKQPNFIKTLPIGVALVGDRGEETSRAFILKVKPRASQHEGRDAETIREIKDLSDEETIKIIVSLISKKVKAVKKVNLTYGKDVLDTINRKYKKNIDWNIIIEELNTKNIIEKENHLILKSEEKKLVYPDENIEKNVQEKLVIDKENLNNIDEQVKDINKIDMLSLRINKEYAEDLAKKTIKTKFLLFKEKEDINDISLKYRKIYKINFNVYDIDGKFINKDIYVDSKTEELIHFTGSKFRISKGLLKVKKLDESDLDFLYALKNKQTIYTLKDMLNKDESYLKKKLKKFQEMNIVDVGNKNGINIFYLNDNFDLPFNVKHKIIDSLKEIPLFKKEIITKDIFDYESNIDDIKECLQKLWGEIEFLKISEIFWPIWEITLINKNNEQRVVYVDGILGSLIIG